MNAEHFEKITFGKSPIGCMNGVWGYRSGLWFLLNAATDPAPSQNIQPSDIHDPQMTATLGRSGMEYAARRMLRFAQDKGGWFPFTAEEVECNEGDLNFWLETGWLLKVNNKFGFTQGLVMLLASRSRKPATVESAAM